MDWFVFLCGFSAGIAVGMLILAIMACMVVSGEQSRAEEAIENAINEKTSKNEGD